MNKETKTITLTIPKEMRLGQAIMNAYREKWDKKQTDNNGIAQDNGEHCWDIWEQDTEDIQERIDNI